MLDDSRAYGRMRRAADPVVRAALPLAAAPAPAPPPAPCPLPPARCPGVSYACERSLGDLGSLSCPAGKAIQQGHLVGTVVVQ